MSASTQVLTREMCAKIVPPAGQQAALELGDLLHSANAGVLVSKAGLVRSEFRDEARVLARDMADRVNTRQAGNATAFVYEETFGTEDRLRFLIHLRSLDIYYHMVEMGDRDRADGAQRWDRLFVDGSLRSTVLLPHSWRRVPGDPAATVAAEQTAQGDEEILHSANAGIVVHRRAQITYGARTHALRYARDFADVVNKHLGGEATAFVYEEAFGATDRVHWLLHLRDLTSYRQLVDLDQVQDDAAEALLRDLGPAEVTLAGGVFVEGSMRDVALIPQRWGPNGTARS